MTRARRTRGFMLYHRCAYTTANKNIIVFISRFAKNVQFQNVVYAVDYAFFSTVTVMNGCYHAEQ